MPSYRAVCKRCGKETDDPLRFRCECGGPLEIPLDARFDREGVKDVSSMWRYLLYFPYLGGDSLVTMGEGWTPLIELKTNTYLKLDFISPTGSFKDRGASALVSAITPILRSKGGFIVEDSSGNAGASVAAYSARAGIKARIYVPSYASGPKVEQIEAYGAELVRVEGTRDEVTRAAMEPGEGKHYVGHVLHPLFRDGMRTVAYEIVEQLDWKAPEYVFVPVSAGTLLLGVLKGFKHLLESGIISDIPTVVACQTEAVSPLYHAFKELPYHPPKAPRSVADALLVTSPPLLDLMVEELRASSGEAEIVDDIEIVSAQRQLSSSGVYVEPSSAVAYAAARKWREEGKIDKDSISVIILTGIGLKARSRSDRKIDLGYRG